MSNFNFGSTKLWWNVKIIKLNLLSRISGLRWQRFDIILFSFEALVKLDSKIKKFKFLNKKYVWNCSLNLIVCSCASRGRLPNMPEFVFFGILPKSSRDAWSEDQPVWKVWRQRKLKLDVLESWNLEFKLLWSCPMWVMFPEAVFIPCSSEGSISIIVTVSEMATALSQFDSRWNGLFSQNVKVG